MRAILSDRRRCDKRFRRVVTFSQRKPRASGLRADASGTTLSACAAALNPRLRLLDAVSKAIIEQLQRDGRMPYAAIGKAVGLSEAAVRQRVQRLIDNGVMQIVAVTDPLQLGFARQAMIGIHAEGDLDPIAEQLAKMSEVDYVILTAGSFDVMVEVVCESDDHLLELLSKRIRAIDGVRGTESFVYLKLHKQTYSWGVR